MIWNSAGAVIIVRQVASISSGHEGIEEVMFHYCENISKLWSSATSSCRLLICSWGYWRETVCDFRRKVDDGFAMRRGSIQLLYLEEGPAGPDADIKYTVRRCQFSLHYSSLVFLWTNGLIFREGRRGGAMWASYVIGNVTDDELMYSATGRPGWPYITALIAPVKIRAASQTLCGALLCIVQEIESISSW